MEVNRNNIHTFRNCNLTDEIVDEKKDDDNSLMFLSPNKIERRWSMTTFQSMTEKSSIEKNTQQSYGIISSGLLQAMLGSKSTVTRRNTLTCVSSIPPCEKNPNISTRRLSLDGAYLNLRDGQVDRTLVINELQDSLKNKKHEIQFETKRLGSTATDISKGDSSFSDTSSPNVPHPLIEYLPLYYLLRRFPKVLAWISKMYAYRWDLHYPLQRRVPFSKKLRKIGIVSTWGEFLLWVPFAIIFAIGIVRSFMYPSVSKSGLIARVPLFICFLTASHNSLITLILGIPVERTIKYHKVSGYIAFLNGMFHTYVAYRAHMEGESIHAVLNLFFFGDIVNLSGTLLLIVITGMLITSISFIRRVAFEVFYYFHILFAMTMLGCAFYHSGIVVPLVGSIVWGGDIVLRKLYMALCRNPRQAFITPITDTVIEVRIPKGKWFDYNPGQYVKICFPDVSLFEWHPISISSSPYEVEVTLHIRTRGSWTKRLHSLSQKKKQVPILLEGPYGSLSVDLTTQRYSIIMLISGGIGVTPMQSIAHQLVYEHEWGERHLKKLTFIWTSRDPDVVHNMEVSNSMRSAIQRQQGKRDFFDEFSAGSVDNNSSSKPRSASAFFKNNNLVMLPADFEKDFVTEEHDDTDSEEDDSQSDDHIRYDEEIGTFSNPVSYEESSRDSTTAGSSVQNYVSEDILELNCFVTSKDLSQSDMMNLPFIHPSRPDIKKLFLDLRQEAINMKEKRVAVCICAPPELVQLTRKACVKYSNRHVRFDFHYEVFE